jgi:hypothetical protein
MKSEIFPLPIALEMVRYLSIENATTIRKHPISKGTMIPPSYILYQAPLGPLCSGQKPPLGSGLVNPESAPKINLQIIYPPIIQSTGARIEIRLLLLLGCTDVVAFAAVAVGFVSAMTFVFEFLNVRFGDYYYATILIKIIFCLTRDCRKIFSREHNIVSFLKKNHLIKFIV